MTVKQIQHLLTYLGYDTSGVDSIWGTSQGRPRQTSTGMDRVRSTIRPLILLN